MKNIWNVAWEFLMEILLKRVELNGYPTVKREVISVMFYLYYNECVFNYTNLGGTAIAIALRPIIL